MGIEITVWMGTRRREVEIHNTYTDRSGRRHRPPVMQPVFVRRRATGSRDLHRSTLGTLRQPALGAGWGDGEWNVSIITPQAQAPIFAARRGGRSSNATRAQPHQEDPVFVRREPMSPLNANERRSQQPIMAVDGVESSTDTHDTRSRENIPIFVHRGATGSSNGPRRSRQPRVSATPYWSSPDHHSTTQSEQGPTFVHRKSGSRSSAAPQTGDESVFMPAGGPPSQVPPSASQARSGRNLTPAAIGGHVSFRGKVARGPVFMSGALPPSPPNTRANNPYLRPSYSPPQPSAPKTQAPIHQQTHDPNNEWDRGAKSCVPRPITSARNAWEAHPKSILKKSNYLPPHVSDEDEPSLIPPNRPGRRVSFSQVNDLRVFNQ